TSSNRDWSSDVCSSDLRELRVLDREPGVRDPAGAVLVPLAHRAHPGGTRCSRRLERAVRVVLGSRRPLSRTRRAYRAGRTLDASEGPPGDAARARARPPDRCPGGVAGAAPPPGGTPVGAHG